MSILTGADLAAFLGGATDDGRFDEYVQTAETLVASHCGFPTLEERAAVERLTVYHSGRQLYSEAGPLVAITEVRGWSNSPPDAPIPGASFELLSVWEAQLFDPAYDPMIFGWVVELDGTYGWTSVNLPADMRDAILNTAAWVGSAHPESGIASERLGDYQYSVRQAPGSLEQDVPGIAARMLEKYRKPSA